MSAEAPIESVVLCEGYHDRAFWAGLLLSRCGCVKSTRDPFGETVQGAGQYGFCTLSGQFARVVPAGGDADRVLQAGRTRLGRRRSKPLRRLVLCIDDDTLGGDGSPRLSAQEVENWLAQQGIESARTADGDHELPDGALVSVLRWSCPDDTQPGVPAQQTLERLICAALTEVYPARAAAVAEWLASRPDPPADSPKAYSWSHMAGWYPDDGGEAFLKLLWDTEVHPAVPAALERRLRAIDAWRIIEALAA